MGVWPMISSFSLARKGYDMIVVVKSPFLSSAA